MTPGGGKRDDREAFERAMADVKPLDPGTAKRSAPKRSVAPPRPPRDRRPKPPFIEMGEGDALGAYATDVGPDPLRKLRRGTLRMEREIDLHGFSLDRARRELERALRAAAAEGVRGIRIVHGQGRHSVGAAILPDFVWEAVTSSPLSELVAAAAKAPRSEGGPGATHVHLRRLRQDARPKGRAR